MKHHFGRPVLVFAFALLATSNQARGSLITFSSRTMFDAAAPGLAIEGFESGNVASGAFKTCPSPLDASSNNACFNAGGILTGIQFYGYLSMSFPPNPSLFPPSPSSDGLVLLRDDFGVSTAALSVNFANSILSIVPTTPANAIGFDALVMPGTSGGGCFPLNIEVYGPGNSLLSSTSSACGSTSGSFFGAINTSGPISRINLYTDLVVPDWAGVDNVAFGNTPEPGMLALVAGGLAAIGWRAFVRRSSDSQSSRARTVV